MQNRMTKKICGQRFTIRRLSDGRFTIKDESTLGVFVNTVKDLEHAKDWVWNMANNHDISRVVIERMNEVFGLKGEWEDELL